MKKTILFTSLLLITILSFGQNKRKEIGGWYNYTNASSNNGVNYDTINNVTLFGDTSVIGYGLDYNDYNYLGYCNMHRVGQVFDPKSYYFGEDQRLDSCHRYTVDSIEIIYKYNHRMDSTVDTLYFQFYQNAQVYRINFVNDSSSYTVQYAHWENASTSPNFSRGLYLLLDSSNDTKGQFSSKRIAIPSGGLVINSNALSAFSVSYLPGYEHNFGDTVEHSLNPTNKLNQFVPLILIDPDKNPAYPKNNGLFVDAWTVYLMHSAGMPPWMNPGDNYSPGNRFLATSFYIKDVSGCIDNVPNINALTTLNIYPNPASNSQGLNIEFELAKQEELTFIITDITGRVLKEIDAQTYQQGKHTLNADISDLNVGMYYINIISNNGSRTTKPIIIY